MIQHGVLHVHTNLGTKQQSAGGQLQPTKVTGA